MYTNNSLSLKPCTFLLLRIFKDLPAPTSCSMGPDVSFSTLVYTAGVGVVSTLLLLSLMGNVVYTIVVCALTRKQKKHLFNLKQ